MGKISPSKLSNLECCPCFEYTTTQGDGAADEGTRMHLATQKEDLSICETPEEEFQVQKSLDIMAMLRGEFEPGYLEFKELLVTIPGPWGRMKGTLDYGLYCPKTFRAKIRDWKYGRLGLPTAAATSLQLRAYAIGFLNYAREQGWRVDELEVGLVAPRTNDVDTHVYLPGDLEGMIKSIAEVVERAEDSFKRPCNSNPEICALCGNSSRCPAMSKSIAVWTPQVAAEYANLSDVVGPVEQMTPMAMARFMAMSSALDEWRKQRKEAVTERVLNERIEVPGYQVVTRAGSARIDDPAAAAQRLMDNGKSLQEVMACATLKVGEVKKLVPGYKELLADVVSQGPDVRYLQKSRKKGGVVES